MSETRERPAPGAGQGSAARARRAVVVLNPAAASGKAARLAPRLRESLGAAGLDVEVLFTERPGHATEIAAAPGDVDVLVAAGGDGTVHEVANGLLAVPAERRPALAVVPVGTGNDFAKLLPAPNVESALELIARGATRRFDVGRATWDGGVEYFVNGMGTGIDVEVVRQIERMPRLPGFVRYLAGVLRALRVFDPIRLRATIDDAVENGSVMIIAVGNGVCQGGGFYLTPDSKPDDGMLDLCIVRELNLPRIARTLPRLMRGSHTNLPDVRMERFRTLRIESPDAPLFFQLDGELREPARARELTVDVVPAALEVVA